MSSDYVAPNGACLLIETRVYKRDAPMALKFELTRYCRSVRASDIGAGSSGHRGVAGCATDQPN
jgi:hypothetical protein